MLSPGVIFDMDGLLLDSERIARDAWREASRRHGHDMPDGLFEAMIGRTKLDSEALLRDAFGPGFDFTRTYLLCADLYERHVQEKGLPLKPGVHEILAGLAARRVPLGVATSTRNPHATQRLEQVGLLGYFGVVVTGDQVARGKPAPDIYLEAARRLGLDPARSFALEDSHAGVRSAHAAGLRVIMVPDLLPPTPELAALTELVAASLHEARTLFEGVFAPGA